MPKWIRELHDADWLRSAYSRATCEEISERLSCSKSAVINALKRHGIEARPPGRPSAPELLRVKEWLEDAYRLLTTHEIAEQMGCSQSAVLDAVKAAGIPLCGHGRRRRKHPYKQRLDDDGNVILEHRYLMEKHLGRKLDPSEHVHHIDRVKDNNSLSNLVVMSAAEHRKEHASEAKQHMAKHNYLRHQRVCKACGLSFLGGNRAMRCMACRSP